VYKPDLPDDPDHLALIIPRPSHLQFLIACSMQRRKEKAWGIWSRDPWYNWCHGF